MTKKPEWYPPTARSFPLTCCILERFEPYHRTDLWWHEPMHGVVLSFLTPARYWSPAFGGHYNRWISRFYDLTGKQ